MRTSAGYLQADRYVVALGSHSPQLLKPIGLHIPVYPVKGCSITDLFPKGGDIKRASFWCGLRPMTPDGTPIVGLTPLPNLRLATGTARLVGRWQQARRGCLPT